MKTEPLKNGSRPAKRVSLLLCVAVVAILVALLSVNLFLQRGL